ncbi:MAG TPA: MFS transporter [Stellaceae bacterium]|jgi:MFS transporter, FSR family, fosmidomycin resistance protein|nr:MFS transporter [Stellaceae bacterium]
MTISLSAQSGERRRVAETTAFSIILALSFSHFLNDMMQSLLPALYPMLKGAYGLNFAQIGMITLTSQLISSVLQPAVGMFADRRPQPYSLAIGMGATLVGLILLAGAGSYPMLVFAAALVGVGSAVFHPEASRVARMASGGRHGLAQSLFQVGGNVGSSLGPVLAAFIVIPWGQSSIAWFSAAALLAMTVLFAVGNWCRRERAAPPRAAGRYMAELPRLSRRRIGWSIVILLAVIFSKAFYTTSLNSYYTFYLISKFDVSIESAQIYLFAFLASVALGTLIGGPVGDRIGRKAVIWVSIVGVFPFTLVLPYANLFWTGILTVVIGMTLASASSAIIVYALELVPGRIGMVAGLFFGLSFGMAGIGAAVLGRVADGTSIDTVYQLCAFLPAIGLLTALLPNLGRPVPPAAKTSPQTRLMETAPARFSR